MSLLDQRSVLDSASSENWNVSGDLEIDLDDFSNLLLRPFRILLEAPIVVTDSVKRQIVPP
jgi:hypothetical protein